MLKRLNKILFITLIFCYSCNAQQNIVLRLNIVDEKKIGIPQAEIILSNKDTSIVTKADLEGKLKIIELKKGTYKIYVSAMGYYILNDHSIKLKSERQQLYVEMKLANNLPNVNVEWEGGWVTLKDKEGNIISIRSKKK